MLTIGIPVYNRVDYLVETVKSIYDQDFKDYKLILVDDCSDIDIKKFVNEKLSNYNIKYYRNKKNIGLSANFKRICELSETDYVFVLCEDDPLFSPNCLSKFIKILDADPELALVASARMKIDTNGKHLGLICEFPQSGKYDGIDVIKHCLMTGRNLIGEPSSVIFRKSKAKRYFNSEYNQLVDLDMWFHLLLSGPMAFYSKPLTSFRVHEAQATNSNVKNISYIASENELLNKDWIENDVVGMSFFGKYMARMRMCNVYYRLYTKNVISKERFFELYSKINGDRNIYLKLKIFKYLKKMLSNIRPAPTGGLSV